MAVGYVFESRWEAILAVIRAQLLGFYRRAVAATAVLLLKQQQPSSKTTALLYNTAAQNMKYHGYYVTVVYLV